MIFTFMINNNSISVDHLGAFPKDFGNITKITMSEKEVVCEDSQKNDILKLQYWIFAYFWCECYVEYLNGEKSYKGLLKETLEQFKGIKPKAIEWHNKDVDNNSIECLKAISCFLDESVIYDSKDPTDLYVLLVFSMVILPCLSFLMNLSLCYLFLACCPAYLLIMMGTLTFRTPVVGPSQLEISDIEETLFGHIHSFFPSQNVLKEPPVDKNKKISEMTVKKLFSQLRSDDPAQTVYYSEHEPPQNDTLQDLIDQGQINVCSFYDQTYYLYKPAFEDNFQP